MTYSSPRKVQFQSFLPKREMKERGLSSTRAEGGVLGGERRIKTPGRGTWKSRGSSATLSAPSLQRGPLAPRQGHGAVRDLSVKTFPTTSLRKRLPRALCSLEWEHTRAPSGTWGVCVRARVCMCTCVSMCECVCTHVHVHTHTDPTVCVELENNSCVCVYLFIFG